MDTYWIRTLCNNYFMKKILSAIALITLLSCQQEEKEIIKNEIIWNTSITKGINPNQFESKIDKAAARAFVKEFGSSDSTLLDWIAVREPLIKKRLGCHQTYVSSLNHYDGLVKSYNDLSDYTEEEFENLRPYGNWESSPHRCPAAVHYFPNCRHIKTKYQFDAALNAMKEVNVFFQNEGLNPENWRSCKTGMAKFFYSKNIVMTKCDLLKPRNVALNGEVGVMQNKFCYSDQDFSNYKPGIQN